MASRNDVDIFYHFSPRLILVRSPSTQINIQDLHDTLRDIEQQPSNLVYPEIISTAGGEDLGDGVTVGLTATLLDARIGFQSHQVFTASGIITSTDATGEYAIDSAANFNPSGVVPGSWIINLEDGSIGTVLNIDSTIQLRTDGIGGGVTNGFTAGDRYKVFEVQQVEVKGGNLVAVDDLDVSINAIFPTAGNQVIRTSASSATQRSSEQLEHSTFEGMVTIDVTSPYSGTLYPIGTPGYPSNNISDAHAIADSRGIKTFKVLGSLTLTGAEHDLSGYVFSGHSAVTTTITIDPSVLIANTEFNNATIQGTLDGGSVIRECRVLDLDYINGFLFHCALEGTITLGGTAQAAILSCYSNIPGSASTPIIDMNGTGNSIVVRDYHGGLEVRNCTGAGDSSIDMSSGQIIFNASVSAGSFTVRGVAKLTDNSTGTAIVDDEYLLGGSRVVADAVWNDTTSDHTTANTAGYSILQTLYNGAIHIDATNGSSGTALGLNGTNASPVDNIADALTLAGLLGFRVFRIIGGAITLTSSLTEWTILGYDEAEVNLNGQNVNGSTFENSIIKGSMSGTVSVRGGLIEDVTGFLGVATGAGFSGNITLGVGQSTFERCHSRTPGTATPTLDFVGAGRRANVRAYSGGLAVENMTDVTNTCTVEFVAGQIVVDSSCTDGVLDIRGVIKPVTDNSAGTNVITSGALNQNLISTRVWGEPTSTQTDTSTMGGYIIGKILTVARFLGLK